MSDLIKREDAMTVAFQLGKQTWKPRFIKKKVMEIPSVEPKQGEWICQDHGAFYPRECSRCHKEPLLDAYGEYVFSGFCPNCGARMKGTSE